MFPMRKSKKQCDSSLMKQAHVNKKKHWDTLNYRMGVGSNISTFYETVDEGTVESFGTYFASVGPMVHAQVHADVLSVKMAERDNNTFALPHIEIEELVTTVKIPSVAKAAEPDALPVRLIKNNFYMLGIHLLHILNHTLENEVYPDELQVKTVIPIFKSGERSDIEKYRLIPLLNAINSFCKDTL